MGFQEEKGLMKTTVSLKKTLEGTFLIFLIFLIQVKGIERAIIDFTLYKF